MKDTLKTPFFKLSVLVGSLILLSGCMSTGKNFPSDLSWVNKEATKQKDVQMLLGNPYSIGSSGGTPTWTYAFYQFKLLGGSHYKELKFYWHPDKSVKHFNFTSSFPADLEMAVPGASKQKTSDTKEVHQGLEEESSFPAY